MKMDHPPLDVMTVQIAFPAVKSLKLTLLSELAQSLEDYTKPPEIVLLQSTPKVALNFQLTPMIFVSDDEKSALHLFSDRVIFRFTKYDSWTETRDMMLRTWKILTEKLEIKEYENFTIEYIDGFREFKRENFSIDKYFHLFPSRPDHWRINYQDFHVGINLHVDKGKFILKLRGLPSPKETTYKIQLESFYRSDIELTATSDIDLFKERLDEAHDIIVKHFYEILTPTTNRLLGVHEIVKHN